jgi:hypothetical protein
MLQKVEQAPKWEQRERKKEKNHSGHLGVDGRITLTDFKEKRYKAAD